jgi:uncharacterized membrane protein YagU involved in acid resistance
MRRTGSIRDLTLHAILPGGLLAGALDILDPMAIAWWNGVQPARVLHVIAAGVWGRPALAGGWTMAAAGLALHFFIACTAAAVYAIASLRWPVLVRRPIACGAGFGVGVYLFMNFVVVPLSAVRLAEPTLAGVANLLFAHVVLVGQPIAHVAARHARATGRL